MEGRHPDPPHGVLKGGFPEVPSHPERQTGAPLEMLRSDIPRKIKKSTGRLIALSWKRQVGPLQKTISETALVEARPGWT